MRCLFFAVALAYGDTCVQVGKPEFGRIQVIAMDSTGATLRGPEIERIEVGSKQSFDVKQPLPYGTYAMRVLIPGFKYLAVKFNCLSRI